MFIAPWVSWFFTDNEGIAQWVFLLSSYTMYCLTSPPVHSSLRSYSGSISGFGDVVVEVLCGLGVSTFIILGLYSVWNVTSNKILLENQAREEAQLVADAERFRGRIVALEVQRQKLIQANIDRRERDYLERATQAFIAAGRPKTPPLGKIFTTSPVQQKPSEWLAGRYVPGRRMEDMASGSTPTRRDKAAWSRRTTPYQTQKQETQAKPQAEGVGKASAGPVASFLRKQDIGRVRVRELVQKKIEQADKALPGDARDWLRNFSQTLGSAQTKKDPKSPAVVDTSSDNGGNHSGDPSPPLAPGSEEEIKAPAGPEVTPTGDGITGDRLFTPYEQRWLREAMGRNQRPNSVPGNSAPTAAPLNTPHGNQGGEVCSCDLTPLLGPHLPMAGKPWPKYLLAHQKTCPKSPYFRPGHPTPGVQLGQGRKTMNRLNNGLTPFLPNQAGPSKFLGNAFSPAKTKFYNTNWAKARFEDEQIDEVRDSGVHYPSLSPAVPGQNTEKALPDTKLPTSKYEYREPQVPLPIHAGLEEWEKRYLSAELRAKDLLRKRKEREEEEEIRANRLWAETAQRQKAWWEKQRETNEQKFIQAQRDWREGEAKRKIEEAREMKKAAEQQKIEEQAILNQLAEIERKENMAKRNQEAAKRIQKLRELEERKQQELKVQEEYQRWQQQESWNRWGQQAQEAQRAALLQQQQQEYQERLQREAQRAALLQQQQQEYQERLQREAQEQQERLQRDIAKQERQQWPQQQNPQWLQLQSPNTNSSVESTTSWTTAPMYSVARPDNNTPGGGRNITVDQRQAGRDPVTPKTNSTLISSTWSDGTQRSADVTPTPAFWGTTPGAAPKRGVEGTSTFRRTSFGPSFSAGIPVTIEEESENMELDTLQSIKQAPSTPRNVFGPRMEVVPVNLFPKVGKAYEYTQQYGNGQCYSSPQQASQPPAGVPRENRHSWQNTATSGFWQSENPIRPGFNLPGLTPGSVAGQATQNNFFHAKRLPGSGHRSVTPKWRSTRAAADGPNSDPGTDLARRAGMKVLNLAELVQMRQRQRQLQQVLNSKRVPSNEVEKLWIEEGLRYDTRAGGFAAVVDEDE